MNATYTWEQLVALPSGTRLHEELVDGIRFLVLRGSVALTAYVGIPFNHPLAGLDYDTIPLDCHGGLTYAGPGDGYSKAFGWFWYGWDYGHAGDRTFLRGPGERSWLLEDVLTDSTIPRDDFRKLVRLADRIRLNARVPLPLQVDAE